MPDFDEDDLVRRAFAAYFRFGGSGAPQPASDKTEVHDIADKLYVTLANVNGLLACYRVRNDGKLKLLVRPPAEIRDAFDDPMGYRSRSL